MDFSSTCTFSHLQAPLFVHVLRRPKAMRKSSSLELRPLRHSSDASALYTLPLRESGWRLSPQLSSGLPPRVWLPSRGFQLSCIPGSLFQLPTPMGFTLQSFSPFDRSKRGFPLSFRSCVFVENLIGLPPTLQRVNPRRIAVPLFASGRISSGRGHMLSWVFRTSRVFSPGSLKAWLFIPKHFPFPCWITDFSRNRLPSGVRV